MTINRGTTERSSCLTSRLDRLFFPVGVKSNFGPKRNVSAYPQNASRQGCVVSDATKV